MRLKRLEMVGFKSFADKTRVDFEAGITAVVGPNGCGKSNISDSIRWALGEMSAKSLRSQQMMDVVFNGTANRPAQGMSEVALTFDNTSGQIPLDYSEVTIARRLFRSGESEYFINKTQCRLKDLRDLFLDTGVGNDGYYVMAQGKIEFILGSKPEERRELFEEAAGVSKYKARREEALRRLSKVDQDMLRLNDSLAIYKQQMDSLDASVRKARQHQKLQEELRTLEIASLLQGYQKAQAQWEAIDAGRQNEEQRVNELRDQLNQQESAATGTRTQWEAMEQQVLELQKSVAQCESDWAKTEAERHAAMEREEELQAARGRLEEETRQLQMALEEGQKAQDLFSSEVSTLRGEYESKNGKFKEEDAKGRGEQETVLARQKELEQSRSRLLELVRLIAHHRNETVRLTSLSIRYEEGSKAKQRELEKAQARKAALEEQIRQQEQLASATTKRLATLEASLKQLDEAQQNDQDAQRSLETSIQDTRERVARLEAERVALQRWLGQDPLAQAAAALRQAALPGVYGPIGELFKTTAPYQRLLDRALGDRTNYFVADSLNDAQAAIQFLSDGRKGWATFLVLDRLTQSEGLLPLSETPGTRSLAEAVDTDTKFRPVLHLLLGRTFYVGATLFEEGLIRGGADPEAGSYQATPADLVRLEQEMQTLKTELTTAEQRREKLKAAVAGREKERSGVRAENDFESLGFCLVVQGG